MRSWDGLVSVLQGMLIQKFQRRVRSANRRFCQSDLLIPSVYYQENTVGTKNITYRKTFSGELICVTVIDYTYIMKSSRELICVM